MKEAEQCVPANCLIGLARMTNLRKILELSTATANYASLRSVTTISYRIIAQITLATGNAVSDPAQNMVVVKCAF